MRVLVDDFSNIIARVLPSSSLCFIPCLRSSLSLMAVSINVCSSSGVIKNHLLIITAGNNSVRLYPPLNISDEDLLKGAEIFVSTIKELGK